MGWLGWTPDEVMRADVNMIQMALKGREELLGKIFGSEAGNKGPITAGDFKSFVRSHNQMWRRREKHGQPTAAR